MSCIDVCIIKNITLFPLIPCATQSNHEAIGREPVIRTALIYYDATNKRVNITERELFEPGDRTSLITEIYLFGEVCIFF